MFEQYLQELGLTDKEAVIYLSLLAVDHASVLGLAEKTKIKRPTVYVVLEALEKKGLVSETQIGKKVHYQAEPPERLGMFIDRQRTVLEEQKTRLKEMLPQFKSLEKKQGERPMVKYFEGRDGIVSSLEDFFDTDDKGGVTYLIYPQDLLLNIFTPEEKEKYRNLRINRGITSKVLYTYEKGEIKSDETGKRAKIDEKKYPIKCDINIYQDRIRINTLGKSLSGIFIRSQDLADTLRSLFDIAYDSIKEKEKPRN